MSQGQWICTKRLSASKLSCWPESDTVGCQLSWCEPQCVTRWFQEYYGRTLLIGICCEDLPEEINRVTLDPQLTDSNGIAAPKVHYRLSGNSERMMAHAIERTTEALDAAGAIQIVPYGRVRDTG